MEKLISKKAFVIYSLINLFIAIVAVLLIKNDLISFATDNFKPVLCTTCDVVRITRNVYNGPFLKIEPEKIWEIEAKVGNKITLEPKGVVVEVLSVNKNSVQFGVSNGQKVLSNNQGNFVDKLNLNRWEKDSIAEGLSAGGGVDWELLFYTKTSENEK
ncbi:MAG: hypothetical protein AAB430_03405 [Patescibacteria group bacterium]